MPQVRIPQEKVEVLFREHGSRVSTSETLLFLLFVYFSINSIKNILGY